MDSNERKPPSGASDSKESACNAGDPGSIPDSGKSPGEGNGNSLQYSCLEDPMDRGAWWTAVHGITESDMTEQLTQMKEEKTFNSDRGRVNNQQ